MDPIRLVARREVTEQFRSKYFRGSVIVQVLLVAAVVIIASVVGGGGKQTFDVALLAGDRGAAEIAEQASSLASAEDAGLTTTERPDRAALEEAVGDGDADAALAGRELIIAPDSDEELQGLLQASGSRVASARILGSEGLDSGAIERALNPPPLEIVEVDEQEAEASAIAFIGGLLLYLALLFTGYAVAGGVVEEKSSRVIELLLAAIRPIHVLIGKLIGVGILGLFQVLAISGVGLGLALALGEVDLPSTTAQSALLILLFFLLGYALYGCAFAAAGATVSRQEDVQSATAPLMMLLVGGYVLSFSALDAPSGTLARVTSLIPPLAPMIVPGRAAKDALPIGDLIASVALMVVAIVLVAWAGARIYERAVLRMGTPLKLRDALGLLGRRRGSSGPAG